MATLLPVAAGFDLLREADLPEISSHARLYRHQRTGAELLSLTNGDENKSFGVTFKTLPADHTGVAHILEHSVLSGSQKYPVKELFMELLKGSCATFINAMTYPDKTTYPVASTNLKDFYNLIDVYLDVVLHPLLESHTLDQEGWHFELERPDAALTYKGVVFNEMKGIYAMPDHAVGEAAMRALMPDTLYALSSGGDPAHIPALTHDQWRQFHKRFYHPSNARLFFWGDDPEGERLAIIDRALTPFGREPPNAGIALQPRFATPRRSSAIMPAAADVAAAGKGSLSVGWLLSEGDEKPERRLAFAVLMEILLGSPASPLKKALLDSRLGEDLVADWGGAELRQRAFITGLKGVTEADRDKVEPLILETLRGLAGKGLDRDEIEAAVNSIEFWLRENNTPQRGMTAMLRALETWLHDGDPIAAIAFAAPLAALKARLQAEPRLFESMISEAFIDNPHRSTVWHVPDAAMLTRQEAEETARLAEHAATLSAAERARIAAATVDLKRRQEAPNSPEQLSRLPALQLGDLERRNSVIPREVTSLGGRPLVHHDLATNGILYLDLGFDLHALAAADLAFVPVLARALVELGTAKESDVAIARRIARDTGGIAPSSFALARTGGKGSASWLFFRGKSTVPKAGELIAILGDLLMAPRLDQRDALLRLVLEEKAGLESSLVMRGNSYCSLRVRATAHAAGYASEVMDGVSQLAFLRGLAADIERDWPATLARLERIRAALVTRAALTANVTVAATSWSLIRPQLEAMIGALPAGGFTPHIWQPMPLPDGEGLAVPTQVNYVAKGANIQALGHNGNGSAAAIGRWLSLAWLIPRIREQGGAYGASLDFDLRSGDLTLSSYRDPNLSETLATYDGTGAYLRNLELGADDLTRSIVGAVNRLDPYQLPGAKGFTSLTRHLVGQTEAQRQQLRDELFATTPRDFREFAALVDAVRDRGRVVIMGSEATLAAANRAQVGNWLAITKVQ